MEMERGAQSGVLKKKSPSGVLIIKHKSGNRNSRGRSGGFGVDGRAKNRVRLLETDSGSGPSSSSGSSDEDAPLEFMRQKVNERRLNNGLKSHNRDNLENRECDRNSVGTHISSEGNKSTLELFDFDEYDEFDPKKMRNSYFEDRFMKIEKKYSGNGMEFGSGSSNRNFRYSDIGSREGLNCENLKKCKKLARDDDDGDMPITLLRSKFQKTAGEPIRVQGKNEILKVTVKNKKKVNFPSQTKNVDSIDLKEKKGLRLYDVAKEDSFADNENSADNEKEETIKVGIQVYKSKKRMKKEEERVSPPENISAIKVKKRKEGKAQRGGSTEKQKLREKIRGMLVDAGWTIDYRPRRNRDYLDAVYISPGGTAYWSITKAHDVLKKQLEDEDGKNNVEMGSPGFGPLTEDLINKLTRQTKRKMKERIIRKRKEEKRAETSDSDENDADSFYRSPKRKRNNVRVDRSSKGLSTKATGRCTLMVRGHDNGDNSDSDGYVPYSGKRTVLAWLIDSGKARLSEKVQYMNRKLSRVMLEGWITRDGIHCGCCSKILSVSKFEVHAGSKLRQRFRNIFLESGQSLLQCQVDAWNSQDESLLRDFCSIDVDCDDPDDDTCGICGDGGDLICCDSCPSTFHQICLEIQELPSGDWHCSNCTCNFCGRENVAEENDTAENELNGCSFCEKKYHKSCSEKASALSLSSDGVSFCGVKCQELYDHLQKTLGIKHELRAGFSWSIIQRKDVSDASQSGFPLRVECNSKLAVALSVMDECFLPIIDRKSGINLIHSVVYNCGSNFNRLNYRGFYTVILERGDEIISAASIRLHGDHFAEMPFIGTREIYRRQGMCKRLLSAIENELSSLEVGKLIIPTISEHMDTWIKVFDFQKLEDIHRKDIKAMNVLVFPGTDILQKELVKKNSNGPKVSDSMNNPPLSPISVERLDKQSRRDSGASIEPLTNDKVESVNSPSVSVHPSVAVQRSDNAAPSISGAGPTKTKDEGCHESFPDSGCKGSDSTNNEPQFPLSPENPNTQARGDCKPCLKPKFNYKVELEDSGSAPPIIPSMNTHEQDKPAPSVLDDIIECDSILKTQETTDAKWDIQIKQNGSSKISKCSLYPAKNNGREIEVPSVDSVSAVAVESSKSENVVVDIDVPEDAGPIKTEEVMNESLPDTD